MWRPWLVGLILGLGFGGVATAETIDTSSTIVAVTVFPDRALVTRRAELKLAKGVHDVRVGSLPGTIEDASISAKGSGEAKVTLFGAKLVTTQLETPQSPRVKELEEQITQVNDRLTQLQHAKEVARQERDFLMSIKAASSDQVGKDIITKQPAVADLESLLGFLDRELTGTYQKELQGEAQARELTKQLDRLNRELSQLYGESRKQETSIIVDLEADTPGRFVLEVSYRLLGATWTPSYEARASSGADTVEIVTSGIVRQRTGEDWRDVTVSLSTARPSVQGRMPEMQPWWLRKQEPMRFEEKALKRRSYDMMKLAADAPAPAEEEGAAFKNKEAVMAQASVETKGPAVVYTLPKPETMLSDWQPRKAAVGGYAMPASLAYEATPRLSPYAYLRAKVTNDTELVLLPGDVQVFLDGAFVGSSSIDLVGPTEHFDLYLGVDERIRVERRQLKAKVDVSVLPGLHGKMKTIDYEYLTTLENRRSSPSEITVIDQLPVSQHDEIKVEQVVFEPKPSDQDEEKPGVHRWTLSLSPGGKQTVKISYRVKHPVDFVVEGL